MSVDDTWFGALRGAEIPDSLDGAAIKDRETIRAHWDNVERSMRDYLQHCATTCSSKSRLPRFERLWAKRI